ncbi:MAG: hemolysin family protein [Anaerolineae bacterium]
MDIGSNILILFFFILANAVFVLSETALVSARKVRLQQRAENGNASAKRALALLENSNLFLATVQIGITLIGIGTGAIGGVTLARPLANTFSQMPLLASYAESLALGIVVLIITFFSIVLGELVPKRLALQNAETYAGALAGPMLFLSKVFAPAIWFLSKITDLVIRFFGIQPSAEPPVTEEEIQLLIDQGTEAGVFEESEQDMVEGVLRLGDQRVYSLMTPRSEIVWLDIKDGPDEIRQKVAESEFSRFPVCQGSLDVVLGIVKARDLLVPSLAGEPIRLKDKLRPAFYIPETTFASQALEIFKEQKREILLVIDEFGTLQGLLTLNDIIEEIVGDFEDGSQAMQRQDGSWLLDGMLPVDEFKEIFHLRTLPHEDEYETLSGFVMVSLGRVPKETDHFEWNGLHFEVMDMDGYRVDKVLVTTLPGRPATSEQKQKGENKQ